MESYLCQENDGLQNKCDSGDSNPMQKGERGTLHQGKEWNAAPVHKTHRLRPGCCPPHCLISKKKPMPDTGPHHRR